MSYFSMTKFLIIVHDKTLRNYISYHHINSCIWNDASTVKDAIQLSAPVSELTTSNIDGNLNISVCIPHQEQDVRATILTESVLETKSAVFSSIGRASEHVTTRTGIEVYSGEPLNFNNISVLKGVPFSQGKDTVITIDSQPDKLSQTMEGITSLSETCLSETASLLQSSTQGNIAGRERTEERKEYEIEVIKSIVYGGLAESITSLSVVSSAAGGGAATLNILALGMANLIGGLFIICHNSLYAQTIFNHGSMLSMAQLCMIIPSVTAKLMSICADKNLMVVIVKQKLTRAAEKGLGDVTNWKDLIVVDWLHEVVERTEREMAIGSSGKKTCGSQSLVLFGTSLLLSIAISRSVLSTTS
ncbi:hypothetical protein OROHE_021776 [Orobanche hederae]